jgi:hypothetical protein
MKHETNRIKLQVERTSGGKTYWTTWREYTFEGRDAAQNEARKVEEQYGWRTQIV